MTIGRRVGSRTDDRTRLGAGAGAGTGTCVGAGSAVGAGRPEIGPRAALGTLATHGTRAAIDGIRDGLADPRTDVRAEAALLLGRLGTSEDYERVAALRIRSPRPLRKIRFGANLLAHRHGLTRAARTRLEDVPIGRLEGDPGRRIEVSPTSDASAMVMAASFGPIRPTHTFGVSVATAGPLLHCGTGPTVVLASEAATAGSVEAVRARPLVLAVGASPAREVDDWSAGWVALSTPTGDDEIALRVYTSSGRLQLAGSAVVDGPTVSFRLGPVVGGRGPQVVLHGTIGGDGLTITAAERTRRPQPGRAPMAD